MTIAERFQAALDVVDDPGLAGPELLPVRLARACARVLPVDDVGLSCSMPPSSAFPSAGAPPSPTSPSACSSPWETARA
jgi:hypothetical protein